MVLPIDARHLNPSGAPPSSPVALSGLRVLVVEDDYYLAMEAKAVLEGAGAEILGPHSTLEQLERTMAERRPDCAVVDINLGEGPTFAAAQRLEADGIPFLFLTGYSPEAIPAEFQHIPQIRKPADPEILVHHVALLTAGGGERSRD